jgi:hypothetical protein
MQAALEAKTKSLFSMEKFENIKMTILIAKMITTNNVKTICKTIESDKP